MASPLAQSQFIFFSRRVAEGTEFSPRNINTPNTLLSLKKIITLRALGVLCGSARGQKNLREEKDVSLLSVMTVSKADCNAFVERGFVSLSVLMTIFPGILKKEVGVQNRVPHSYPTLLLRSCRKWRATSARA